MVAKVKAQLALALGPYENRKLFSDHFLEHRLPLWPEFRDAGPEALFRRLHALWNRERAGLAGANEAQTEERWIKPVLALLGFSFTVQAGITTAAGHRQPDYALFADESERAKANLETGSERFARAIAVCDAKRFDRPLDRRHVKGALSEDPVAQIIHYVVVTRARWGLLTNGRLWRLYAAEGDLVEGACVEVDLCALLDAGDTEAFRYFATLFGARSFVPGPDRRSLVDRILDGSRSQSIAVGETLRRQVLAAVPLIAEGLLGDEPRAPESLGLAFDHALVVLYRLLFCLHAEDRELLPVDNEHYLAYSLREHRRRLARQRDEGRVFSVRSDDLFNDLRALFRIVDRGDAALGVNEYNGGLFSPDGHPWLQGRAVPDDLLAEALDLIYRVAGEQVDYRSLSVRHLGTIFEQLLAFQLAESDDCHLRLVPAPGRKLTGAYFTPEHIVDEIVRRTLDPIYDRRSQALAAGADTRAPLDALLDIHVLDPAMGSGHFLVGAVSYLARRIANDPSYDGELSLAELQGLVAERCLYGVDINPLAVEVARLSLWLTTVRDDRPLRFLGNLRAGDSLVSVDLERLLAAADDLLGDGLAARTAHLLERVAAIAAIDVRSADDAHQQERIAAELAAARAPLIAACDRAVRSSPDGHAGHPFHWAIEFPERFFDAQGAPLADPGFDAVVGNPPYIRIQELNRPAADHLRANYATASGSFDIYVTFVERGLDLLHRNGRLGYIVPSAFIKLDYGKGLRDLLCARRATESIVDFGHTQIFSGATNYTCLLIADRSGQDTLAYRRMEGDGDEVRRALMAGRRPPAIEYPVADLGADPWVLVSRREREIVATMEATGEPLASLTTSIFTGLQTSADDIYIVEDRGRRGGLRVVRSGDEEFELEPDLLHPLASGGDVERYALRTLRSLLLFPYRERGDGMALLTAGELASLPRTWDYLRGHEARLRARERGKMNQDDGWWAYNYPKSLGLHDHPKLGVAATVQRLEVAADPDGAAYFHNVRVNGILPRDDGPSLWALTALLNSRAVDYAFRRRAAPLQNGFFTANKQFISWLPVLADPPAEVGDRGERLHALATEIERERSAVLDWLGSVTGADVRRLPGFTKVARFDEHDVATTVDFLDRNRKLLKLDPRTRANRELLGAELARSNELLTDRRRLLAELEHSTDQLIYDCYGLSATQRAAIDAEYD